MSMTQKQKIREHHTRFREQVERSGNELRDRRMPALTEEKFSLYEKCGNRLIYENDYFERRKFLAVFGLLSIWYGRPEDILKLEEVIGEICQEETWALPAHVDRREPDWTRTVDLFACETGQALAHILSLTKDAVSKELALRAKELIVYRLLDSYMEKPKGQWRWESFYNNWVAVCAGCLGSMALYLLEDDREKQQAIVDRVCDTLPDYIAGMLEDGTCTEGMSYFTYGMVFYTGFARQLYEHTGGRIDLMASGKVQRIARFQQICYLPGKTTVSFSDGDRRDRFRLGLTCFLAKRVEGVVIPDIDAAMDFESDHCYRFMGNWQDDCWVQEYLKEAAEEEEKKPEWFTLLPDAQWAVWKTRETGIAIKGGNNGEPHNHNDVGSFLMTAGGEVFLADLGCGEYTKDYFREETRYTILCNRSLGHSVPIVNGGEQKCGSEYGAEYLVSDQPGSVRLSFAGAYNANAPWKLLRRLKSAPDGRRFEIADSIKGTGAVSMEENLVTQIEPVIEENKIFLSGKRGRLRIALEGECGGISAVREVFRNHHGAEEAVWLLRFEVILKEGTGSCLMRCTYEPGEELKKGKTL